MVLLAGVGVVLYSLEDIDHPEAGTGSDARRRAISTTAEEREHYLETSTIVKILVTIFTW